MMLPKGKEVILSTEAVSINSEEEEDDQGQSSQLQYLVNLPSRSSGLAFETVGQPKASVEPNINLEGETLTKGLATSLDPNYTKSLNGEELNTSTTEIPSEVFTSEAKSASEEPASEAQEDTSEVNPDLREVVLALENLKQYASETTKASEPIASEASMPTQEFAFEANLTSEANVSLGKTQPKPSESIFREVADVLFATSSSKVESINVEDYFRRQ
jgi:hypothetical protein